METLNLLSLVVLTLLFLGYLVLARKFNVLDIPNQRSSHSKPVVRGAGVVFLFAIVLGTIPTTSSYVPFLVGVLLVGTLGFLDDLVGLSARVRLAFQSVSIGLIVYQLELLELPILLLVFLFVGSLGVLNAYNFMDGINGITSLYSILMVGSIWILFDHPFADDNILYLVLYSLILFSVYNVRKNAVCFCGDVGSLSIGYFLIFLTLYLIFKTLNPVYILLWLVYGVDSLFTILKRALKSENIFSPHRSHLYQVMVNEFQLSHVLVASIYALVQLVVNGLLYFYLTKMSDLINPWIWIASNIVVIGFLYLLLRKKYSPVKIGVQNQNQ